MMDMHTSISLRRRQDLALAFCRWNVLGLREDHDAGHSRMTTIGIRGLCVPLSECWEIWGIGSVTRMAVMSLSRNHNQPGITGLSSCLCYVLIKDFCIERSFGLVLRCSFSAFLYTSYD